MSEYCYFVDTTDEGEHKFTEEEVVKIKEHVEGLYRQKRLGELAFNELPFDVYFAEHEQKVCIRMNKHGKKVLEQMEAIHKKLTKKNLEVQEEIYLQEPEKMVDVLFEGEACTLEPGS